MQSTEIIDDPDVASASPTSSLRDGSRRGSGSVGDSFVRVNSSASVTSSLSSLQSARTADDHTPPLSRQTSQVTDASSLPRLPSDASILTQQSSGTVVGTLPRLSTDAS
eukprot:gene16872-18950_t